jgi:predicted chitinase/LysM repeat protein
MRLSDFDNTTRGLTIFDIDDTLFHTTAKIKVVRDGKVIRSLTNQEFNNYTLLPGEEFDFGEFRSAEKFNKESRPIKPMIEKLKAILDNAGNSKVIMLTARADFDNRDLFLNTFAKYGIDMSQVHVHRAGNLAGNAIPAEKKAIWVRRYLNTGKFNRVSLYDDSMSNLRVFNSLKDEYPNISFQAIFVKPDGSIKLIKEEFLDNLTASMLGEAKRKKKKKRVTVPAYGPGPFGGYGFYSGYSGDSGAGDAGGGDGGGFEESWTKKYKKSIDCSNPKGFSQKAHCAGRQARQSGKNTTSKSVNEKIGDVSQFAEPGDTVYSIARQNNLDPVVLMKFNNFNKDTKLKPGQEVKIPQKTTTTNTKTTKQPTNISGQGTQPATITDSSLETTLRDFAIKAGIKGQELAQFLAQCAHETANFATLTEFGDPQDFLKKYDLKYNPEKAKKLGNTNPGDGERFKGRGFIQLTGRWNYTQAGQALGLPLDQKPQLLERPDVAAKASVWFWKNRVQPNVKNFTDTRAVTSYINPGLLGLQRRHGIFQNYLKTMNTAKEDYHPNATPPGPETKPTMPAGTVRVDVDDVYDWYKLGQHISNMKGLGKHDFGKGPPSTIFSFGSEEEEHKYINDLEKTGLTTTDIDPVDPRQPKGMKRQKTDPTFNVAENFADGKVKGKSRPGRVQNAGASCDGSVTSLRQRAKDASGERAKMYHWCANMKSGRKK